MTTKVQIIEDNDLNIDVLRGVLRVFDVDLEVARDGPTGLERARVRPPDLLLLDLQLPGIDGETILTTLRSDPALKDLAIVVVTAKAMKGEREKVLDLGANHYITKPIDVVEFREVLSQYLQRRPRGNS